MVRQIVVPYIDMLSRSSLTTLTLTLLRPQVRAICKDLKSLARRMLVSKHQTVVLVRAVFFQTIKGDNPFAVFPA